MSEEMSAPVEGQEELVTQEEGQEEILEEQVEQAEQPSEEEKKAEQALRKKYALKVNNKVKELELDLSNDDEVQKYLQKALAADEKFEEAAQIRRGFAQLVEQIRTNPLTILSHPDIGVDLKALAQQVLSQEVEDMNKTPEQKKIEELERKLQEKEELEKRIEEEKRQAEMQRLEAETFQELDMQITEALNSAELPKSAYVVKRIADTMITAWDMGYKDVTVKDIMPFVEEQLVSELNQLFEAAPEQGAQKLMERFVGKKNLDRYRRNNIARAKARVPETAKSVKDTGADASSVSKPVETERISTKKLMSW